MSGVTNRRDNSTSPHGDEGFSTPDSYASPDKDHETKPLPGDDQTHSDADLQDAPFTSLLSAEPDPEPNPRPYPTERKANLASLLSRKKQYMEEARQERRHAAEQSRHLRVNDTIARQMKELEMCKKKIGSRSPGAKPLSDPRSLNPSSRLDQPAARAEGTRRTPSPRPLSSKREGSYRPADDWEKRYDSTEKPGLEYTSADSIGVRLGSTPVDDWEAMELQNDLRIQIDATKRQIQSKEDKLSVLHQALEKEDSTIVALQAKKSRTVQSTVEECSEEEDDLADLLEAVEHEKRLTQSLEERVRELESAEEDMDRRFEEELGMPKKQPSPQNGEGTVVNQPGGAAHSELSEIMKKMTQRLCDVKGDMENQFMEEREKLEGRLEFLTRLNERKAAEIESLHVKKGEINNLISQVKDSHRSIIDSYRSKYEHENTQVLKHERGAHKAERELRMISDECEKLKERIRKAGGHASAMASPAPSKRAGSSFSTPDVRESSMDAGRHSQ